MQKAYMEIGGALNNLVVIGERGLVSFGITSRLESTRVKNIKGKTLGSTLNAHAVIPSRDLVKNLAGFISMHIRKKNTKIVKMIFEKDLLLEVFNLSPKFV